MSKQMPKGDQGENEEVFRLLEVIYTFATLQTLQEKKPSSKKEGKKSGTTTEINTNAS